MYCEAETGFPIRVGGLPVLIFHGTIDVIIMLIVLSSNLLIAFAILRYHRKLKLAGMLPCPNHASVRLVLSLSVADILVACSTIYFLFFEYSCDLFYTWGRIQWLCLARFVPYMATASASCFSLMALAVDRYIAVVHSMRYREIMTTRTTNLLIVAIWICASLTGGTLIFWNNWEPNLTCEEFRIIPFYYVTIVCCSFAVIAITTLGVLHWLVHREAEAANERKRSMKKSVSSIFANQTIFKVKSFESCTLSLNSKSARVMYLIVGCIIVLWTPVTALVIIRCQGMNSPHIDFVYGVTFTFYNLTYIVNSFVYSWKNSTIKLAILQVFGSTRRKPSTQSVRTNSVLQNSTVSEFNSTSSVLNVA